MLIIYIFGTWHGCGDELFVLYVTMSQIHMTLFNSLFLLSLHMFFFLKYVDFSIGDDSGYLRFEDSKAAEKARMSAVLADEGGLIVKDHIVTLEPVTGN